jgi:hypothetical protein
MKMLSLLFGLLLIAGLNGSTLAKTPEKKEVAVVTDDFVGEIVHIRGQALLTRGGENYKVQKTNAVRRNDKIKTGPNSIVIIGFGPDLNSKMKIDQDSEIVVDWKSPKREQPKNEFHSTVDVIKGSINVAFNKNRQKDNNLNVKTKYATFGIRGTEFFVHTGINDTAFLAVKSGKVASIQYDKKAKKNLESDTEKEGTLILTHKFERFAEQNPDWYQQINWDMDEKKYHFHQPELQQKMYLAYEKNIKDKSKPEDVGGIEDLLEELYQAGGGTQR